MPSDPDDFQHLMARLRAGSDEAAREFLGRYGPHILRVVRRRLHRGLRQRYDSRDFVQSVWADFLAQPAEQSAFDGPDQLAAYLAKMAAHKIISAARRNREPALDGCLGVPAEEVFDRAPTPSQAAIARERWHRLQQATTAPGRRILELLRQGVTREEIARRLGIHERTIRRLIRNLPPESRA
jgi:RNA polymerase sigma factor (sigma-70 family)